MEKLTAIIPTKNEEDNIEGVLKSVSFADEVMVVDSFSTDKTLELAKKYTDFIIQREYQYSASQKNWAIPRASNQWILLVDADERVTPELKSEIQAVLKSNTDKSAFWIHRKNAFMGKPVRFSGWQNDKVIRLFKRDSCRYEDKHVHAEIKTQGKIGKLKQPLIHNTYKSLKTYLVKIDRYTTWSAYDRVHKTKNINFFHLAVKPMYRFFSHYILRLGFLDGKTGFVISVFSAYSVFLRSLKVMQIKKNEAV
ncbi:MAG: glycosyltransferase family 2 protein [Desulfobacterales bacterium]